MLSRREVLVGSLAAGVLGRGTNAAAAAIRPDTQVNFQVPRGACDCHTHVFGDPSRFPLSPTRAYTPPTALPEELLQMHRALGIERVVIVTASAYGANNAATLEALRLRGPNARGVIVTDEDTSDDELDRMHLAGVRGVRLYLGSSPDRLEARQRLRAMAARIKGRKWHVQLFTEPTVIAALKETILELEIPIVIDHFGGALGRDGTNQRGFAELVSLVASGQAYVKLAAAYRFSTAPDYADMLPLARTLIEANPERVLWASDWPHTAPLDPTRKPTELFPFMPIDDARMLNLLASWAPDSAVRQRILVENPARLYGFSPAG